MADPFTGTVSFATAGAEAASTLPDAASTTLPAKVEDTIPVTITNTGSAPEDYYLDPRLTTATVMTLAPITEALTAGSNTLTLPGKASATFPLYWVPSQSSSITVKQTSTISAMTDLSPATGDPDVASSNLKSGSLCGRSASVSYTAPGHDLTPGLWGSSPTECGPFTTAAKSGKATDTATVTGLAFDKTMTPSTGDLQELALERDRADQGRRTSSSLRRARPPRSTWWSRHRARRARWSRARSTSMTWRPACRRTTWPARARWRRCRTRTPSVAAGFTPVNNA